MLGARAQVPVKARFPRTSTRRARSRDGTLTRAVSITASYALPTAPSRRSMPRMRAQAPAKVPSLIAITRATPSPDSTLTRTIPCTVSCVPRHPGLLRLRGLAPPHGLGPDKTSLDTHCEVDGSSWPGSSTPAAAAFSPSFTRSWRRSVTAGYKLHGCDPKKWANNTDRPSLTQIGRHPYCSHISLAKHLCDFHLLGRTPKLSALYRAGFPAVPF